jgi:hypothetical protein
MNKKSNKAAGDNDAARFVCLFVCLFVSSLLLLSESNKIYKKINKIWGKYI